MFVLVLLAFGIIALAEIPPLVKKKMWRELAAFSLYFLLGLALSLPQALGLKVPNPTKAIEALFRPLSELLK
ncbi:MAG: hypothetical protein ACUVSK_07805 [Desulfotomaculales bacterium]